MKALVGTGGDYDLELARIFPTWPSEAAFLLWDSLPAAEQADYYLSERNYSRLSAKETLWTVSERTSLPILMLQVKV